MNDLPYQNETFLKLRESRFQIQAVYSAKKLPVLIFLIHIFFFVSITLFSILGIYYLIKSLINHSNTNKEFYNKVKDWNLTDYKRFKNLNIEIYSPDNHNYSK
ncbi:MAG: hypothetical protein MJ252_24555, partial [archaeon]|nr:hypothetical protein [archaeon]